MYSVVGSPQLISPRYDDGPCLVLTSLSAVSEAPTSEVLGVETLWRGASDTAT